MKNILKNDLHVLDEILASHVELDKRVLANVESVKSYMKQLAFRKSCTSYYEEMFNRLLNHIETLLVELNNEMKSASQDHATQHYYKSYIESIEEIKEGVIDARSDLGSFVHEVDREHLRAKCVNVLASDPIFMDMSNDFVSSYGYTTSGLVSLNVKNDSLNKLVSLLSLDDKSLDSLLEVLRAYSLLRKRKARVEKTAGELELFEGILNNSEMIKNYLAYRSVANKQVPYIKDICERQADLMDEYDRYEEDTSIFKLFTKSMREKILSDANLLYTQAVVEQTILDDIKARLQGLESNIESLALFDRVIEFAEDKCDLALYSTDAVIAHANFVEERNEAEKVIEAARTRKKTLTNKLDRQNKSLNEQRDEFDKTYDSLSKDAKEFVEGNLEFYASCYDLLATQYDNSFDAITSLIVLHLLQNVNSLSYFELNDLLHIDITEEEYTRMSTSVVNGAQKFYNDRLALIEATQKKFDINQFVSYKK